MFNESNSVRELVSKEFNVFSQYLSLHTRRISTDFSDVIFHDYHCDGCVVELKRNIGLDY